MISLGYDYERPAVDQEVLRAYYDSAKDPSSDEEFLSFWNSLTEMEKRLYLRRHLPMLFYTAKDVQKV